MNVIAFPREGELQWSFAASVDLGAHQRRERPGSSLDAGELAHEYSCVTASKYFERVKQRANNAYARTGFRRKFQAGRQHSSGIAGKRKTLNGRWLGHGVNASMVPE
jgi:hypothetical protein